MHFLTVTYLSNILVVITEAQQKVRKNVDNIGLKNTSKHCTQHLKCKQCSCQTGRDKMKSMLAKSITFD